MEILQVRGLPVLIRRDPSLLPLDMQRLALGGRGHLGMSRGCLGPSRGCLGMIRGCLGLGRGCLGLGRGCLGLGRVVDLDGGLMQILGEDVRGNRRSPRGYFSQFVRSTCLLGAELHRSRPPSSGRGSGSSS
jgi:hypothetical protein